MTMKRLELMTMTTTAFTVVVDYEIQKLRFDAI